MDNTSSPEPEGQAPVPMTKSAAQPETRPSAAPVAEAEMRASDADRERVAELLRDAYADGRLTVDEHSERIEAAYAAKTLGELVPLTRDLPAHRSLSLDKAEPAPAVQLPPARQEAPKIVAVFGGAERKGRWRVGPHLKVVAVFGGVDLDLTDAVFESPEVAIEVVSVFGGVEVKVPENVNLHGSGAGIFGGFSVREQTVADPYAPVVRVTGAAVFGGVEAKPRRGKKLKEWVRRQING